MTLLVAAAVEAWAYLEVFTDTFTLRQSPIQRIASPEGGWELRVYEDVAGSNHDGIWLATVLRNGVSDAEQRTVYYGDEVIFTWLDERTVLASEYPTDMPGAKHRIDVVVGSYGVEDRWADDTGLLFVVAVMLLVIPAGIVLVVGLCIALFLPRLIWRAKSTPRADHPAVDGSGAGA